MSYWIIGILMTDSMSVCACWAILVFPEFLRCVCDLFIHVYSKSHTGDLGCYC